MQIVFRCPRCRNANRAASVEKSDAVRCAHCDWVRPVAADEMSNGLPTRCLACGCQDLWRQKDFPQGLGLLLVGLGIVISTFFWAYHMPALALGTLMAFAAGDLLLYLFMKDVLVCYRCAARFNQVDLGDTQLMFNLETAERYRQEARRLDAATKPGGPG